MLTAIIALATASALALPTVALTSLPQLSRLPTTAAPATTAVSPRPLSTLASSRRTWLGAGAAAIALSNQPTAALAGERTAATLDRVENYEAPKAEEKSPGLVVLRVAEVAAFQEKLCRAVAEGGEGFSGPDGYSVNRMQLAFGMKVLLKNSNLDGNLKLVLKDVPKPNRAAAAKAAALAMNSFGELYKSASEVPKDDDGNDDASLSSAQLLAFADKYRDARVALYTVFGFLPQAEQDRFFGYATELKAYEDRIAKGDNIEY